MNAIALYFQNRHRTFPVSGGCPGNVGTPPACCFSFSGALIARVYLVLHGLLAKGDFSERSVEEIRSISFAPDSVTNSAVSQGGVPAHLGGKP